ncbi:TIP41-like family-domain-containing protein [Geopyxis carbonaria]|nr:TIP41-like family-domain-containing protein [Geopyxis carbonaria]
MASTIGTGTFVAPMTVRDSGKQYTQSGWRITTHKYPICNSAEIEDMTSKLGIAPPEMIFGNNSVSLEHVASGWTLTFNAFDALDVIDKTGEVGMLKVAYSEHWQRMREKVSDDIRDVVRPFDWTYSSAWRGQVKGEDMKIDEAAMIPFDKLRQPDPILLFDDVMLYEDELADNGITMLNIKIRVMPERLLLLQRFFLRLDDVVIRLRDTRIYIEFATGEVIREYISRESAYSDVKKKLAMYPPDEIPSLMRDPNKLVDFLQIVETIRETKKVL